MAHDAVNASWAVVYYIAGHGLELDGTNYLVPTDVKYENDSDIPKESVPLDEVLNAVGEAADLRLVILDACGGNPLVSNTRSVSGSVFGGRGPGSYRTGERHFGSSGNETPGNVAADRLQSGKSPHPVCSRLDQSHESAQPKKINAVFRLVHDVDVYAIINKRQEPFAYGQLPAKAFYFRRSGFVAGSDPGGVQLGRDGIKPKQQPKPHGFRADRREPSRGCANRA